MPGLARDSIGHPIQALGPIADVYLVSLTTDDPSAAYQLVTGEVYDFVCRSGPAAIKFGASDVVASASTSHYVLDGGSGVALTAVGQNLRVKISSNYDYVSCIRLGGDSYIHITKVA